MPRVSFESPCSARRVDAMNSRSRTARFFSDACAGCCVVFCNGITHLPVRPRDFGGLGRGGDLAFAQPIELRGLSTTRAPALVAASSLF